MELFADMQEARLETVRDHGAAAQLGRAEVSSHMKSPESIKTLAVQTDALGEAGSRGCSSRARLA